MNDENVDGLVDAWARYRYAIAQMHKDPSRLNGDMVQAYGLAFHHLYWKVHHDVIAQLLMIRFPEQYCNIADDNGKLIKIYAMPKLISLLEES